MSGQLKLWHLGGKSSNLTHYLCNSTQMMDWDDLRFFIELARCGSLSETARRLQADHSTVARRVGNLEQALGLKLFDRLPRGCVLTAEGQRLNERSAAVEEAIFSFQRQAQNGGDRVEGLVRVSVPPSFGSLWLVPRLTALRDQFPKLILDISGQTERANLSHREADLAVRLTLPKLGDLHYGLYGSRAYLKATHEDAYVFLGYDEELEDVPQQRWIKQVAQGRSFSMLANDLTSLIAGVRAGMGLAAIPHILVEGDDDLISIAEGKDATREIWLVVHSDLRKSARVRVVMDYLVSITAPLRQ